MGHVSRKIPTAGKITIWLFTQRSQGVALGTTENKSREQLGDVKELNRGPPDVKTAPYIFRPHCLPPLKLLYNAGKIDEGGLEMTFTRALADKNVTNHFNVLVSIIWCVFSHVSTRIGVIGISLCTKPNSGITIIAIAFIVGKKTDSYSAVRCRRGDGIETFYVAVAL